MSYPGPSSNTCTAVPNASATGLNTKALVAGSEAEGDTTQALSDGAHSEGKNTVVIGDGGHAEGQGGIVAENVGGHVEGVSNIAGNTPRPFTVVGTTVTIQGAVDDEFVNGETIRFSELTGGAHNTLFEADRIISVVTANQTGSLVMYLAQGSNTANPHLYSVNKGTGAVVDLGALLAGGLPVSITGMAMDPTTGIMYAVSGSASPNLPQHLFTLNLATAVLTDIGPLLVIQNAYPVNNLVEGPNPDICFDRHGNLWGSCFNSNDHQVVMAQINKATAIELVYKVDRSVLSTVGMAFAFMNDSNRLFLVSGGNGQPGGTTLYEINPQTFLIENQLTLTGPAANIIIGAMKFDDTNTLYGVSNQAGVFALYTINITTGATTSVALTRDYDALGVAIAYNTTMTISSGLDDRTGGQAVNALAGSMDHVEGQFSNANDGLAHSEGYTCAARGNGSHAEGWQTVCSGAPAHSEGLSTFAIGANAHTEGNGTSALEDQGHAEGFNSASRAKAAHAEGLSTVSAGNWSHSEGGTGTAYGDSSHVEGGSTQTNSEGGHVEGEGNRCGNLRRAFTIAGTTITIPGGNFTSEFTNGNTTRFADLMGGTNQTLNYADRTINSAPTFNVGPNTTTFNINTALDDRTSGVCFDQSVGQDGHVEGSTNTNTGFGGHVEGSTNTNAAFAGHCEGEQNTINAAAEASHCEGDQNAIGAAGFAAHCEGTGNTSNGNASHCEGDSSSSTGFASHAEGNTCTASGNGAHAEGVGTTATAAGGHARGQSSVARLLNQSAQGSGGFAVNGDAQDSLVVARIQTTNAVGTVMFLDGSTATQRITIPANTTYGFRVRITARQTGGVDACAFFVQSGFLTRGAAVGSTRINVGTQEVVSDAGSSDTWTAVLTADVVNGALTITVTGQAGKNINWVATVELIESAG
jgi:hypothetical protein